jgi:hypothetical protein
MPLRTEVAGNLVMVGGAMITSSHLLHLRDALWSQGPAVILLRTGLELSARGGWVALGTDDEAERIRDAATLPNPRTADVPATGANGSLARVVGRIRARWPQADDPERVYRCGDRA